jgi:SAM-dependent methyltransferase
MVHPPTLPDEVTVLPGTDVAGEWVRFQPSEPLHYSHDICVPMSAEELDRVVDRLGLVSGSAVLDIACGHVEMLMSIGERARTEGTGLDLSPWALTRAVERSRTRPSRGRIEWWLGHGRSAPRRSWDVATCLGAPWICHGFAGTVRALRDRVLPGGRVAIGDLRLRAGIDPGELPGSVTTRSDQLAAFSDLDTEPVAEIVSADSSWRTYSVRVIANAAAYAVGTEGDPERDRRAAARAWIDDLERDRRTMVWSVWIVRRRC